MNLASVMRNQALQEAVVEIGTIEREIYVEASPEVLFEVVSRPEHVREWWPDEAWYDVAPGSAGEIVFSDVGGERIAESLTVLEVRPPETFSFRWTEHDLLVTFSLTPSGTGTLLRMTETGFREIGWEVAQLEELYQDHVDGWAHYLPRIAPYAATLEVRS